MEKVERIYTIPLGDAYDATRNKRAPRAVKILREFVARHMKAENVLLSTGLNSFIWQKSIQKPPRRVKVRLIKEDGTVRAYLADEKIEEPKKEEKKAEEKKAPEKKEEVKKEEPKAKKAEPEKKEKAKEEKKPEAKPEKEEKKPESKPVKSKEEKPKEKTEKK